MIGLPDGTGSRHNLLIAGLLASAAAGLFFVIRRDMRRQRG